MTELFPMNPQEAGFDGAKGISLNISRGGVYKLRRGTILPWETQGNFENQLIWQESEPPHLFYCNSDGKWFELLFTPIQR